jgi:hypothetical protein
MQLLPHLQSYRLGSLCEAMGVSLEGAHRASNDAEATGRLLLELAKRKGAPDALPEFIEWADAIAPPPDTGHLKLGPRGVVELCEEPWAGRTVEELPDILQWMTMALQRQGGAWTHRYPAPVRQWARRWLRLRASGSAKPATARPAPGAASAGSGLLGGGPSRAAAAEGGLRRGNPAEWNLEPSPWLRWSAGSA